MKIFKLLVLVSCLFVLTGCRGKNEGEDNVAVVGSTTVAPLMQQLADAYFQVEPSYRVEIQAVGSSAGIQAVIDGTADIGISSRELEQEEIDAGCYTVPVAYDGIAVAVHPSNPVEELTMEELHDIYTGEITNWSEVGGNDEPIIVLLREEGSGARSTFEDTVGIEKNVDIALVCDGTGSVKASVASKENAIGYMSIGTIDDTVKTVAIDGIEPTVENIANGTYPISLTFNLVFMEGVPLSTNAQAFYDFIFTPEGKAVIEQHYIPIPQ